MAAASSNLGRLAEAKGDGARARAFYEQALAVLRELGDRRGCALTLNNLALLLEAEGEWERARRFLRESLAIFHELGERKLTVSLLNALGGLEAAQDPLLGARLLSVAEALREELGGALTPADSTRFQECVARLREKLGDERLGSVWKDGRALGLEGAIALALESFEDESRP
jgi:tetratricopeptide (TPR) repeat protein